MKSFFALIVALLPSAAKKPIFRFFFGYRIGAGVRIGLSVIAVDQLEIGDNTRIGHFNVLARSKKMTLGRDVVIGHLNMILGGRNVQLGDGAMIVRGNEINSILKPLVRGVPNPELILGRRAIITAAHKIDFTDRVEFGDGVVFAGRLSNIWTHNRQDIGPVSIGAQCYVGSGVQMVPGSSVGPRCVVGLSSVITKTFTDTEMLIAGVPAKIIKPLDEDSLRLVDFPPRPDLDGYADLAVEGNEQDTPYG